MLRLLLFMDLNLYIIYLNIQFYFDLGQYEMKNKN